MSQLAASFLAEPQVQTVNVMVEGVRVSITTKLVS